MSNIKLKKDGFEYSLILDGKEVSIYETSHNINLCGDGHNLNKSEYNSVMYIVLRLFLMADTDLFGIRMYRDLNYSINGETGIIENFFRLFFDIHHRTIETDLSFPHCFEQFCMRKEAITNLVKTQV